MSKAYITEFPYLPLVASLAMPPLGIGAIAGGTPQAPVDYSAGAASSAAFAATTKYIRLNVDATCSFKCLIAGNGSAAAVTDTRMPADTIEYWQVNPGDKLSFITNT